MNSRARFRLKLAAFASVLWFAWIFVSFFVGGITEAFFYFYAFMIALTLALESILMSLDFLKESFVGWFVSHGIDSEINKQDFHLRMRMKILKPLATISASFQWPMWWSQVLWSQRPQQKNKRAIVTLLKTNPSSRVLEPESLYCCSFALLLFVFSSVNSPYRSALSITVLVAIASKHLIWLLFPGGVLSVLKRSIGNPLMGLVTLVTCDLLALSLSISLITTVHCSKKATLTVASNVALQLIKSPKRIGALGTKNVSANLRRILNASILRKAEAGFGLLMYAALLRAILADGLKGLTRNDEDYEQLAKALNLSGNPRDALKLLQKTKHLTRGIDYERSFALLCMGRISEAKLVVERMLGQRSDERFFKAETEDIYFELFLWWLFIPSDAKNQLCESARRSEVSESARFCYSELINLYETIDENNESATSKEVYNLPSAFGEAGTLLRESGPGAASDRLKNIKIANLGDKFAKFSAECMIASSSINPEERRQGLKLWFEVYHDDYENLCSDVSQDRKWVQKLGIMFISRLKEYSDAYVCDESFSAWLTKIYEKYFANSASERSVK